MAVSNEFFGHRIVIIVILSCEIAMAADFHPPDPSHQRLSYAERIGAQWRDFLILVARVLIGLIYVLSGWGKVTGIAAFIASLERQGVPAASVLGYLGAITEFFGGLAILLGFGTRWAALAIFIFTIAATLIGHRYWEAVDPALRRTQQTQFLKNLTMMGGMVLLFITGGGRFSLDRLLWRRRSN
jgi:putative oxidoreductase